MTTRQENFRQNAAARARCMRMLAAAKKAPSRAEIAAALALIAPLSEDPYRRLMTRFDHERLQRSEKGHPVTTGRIDTET